jgi:hypothetical protein
LGGAPRIHSELLTTVTSFVDGIAESPRRVFTSSLTSSAGVLQAGRAHHGE